MARHKSALPSAANLRLLADADGGLLVRVTPGARTEGIDLSTGKVLVKVRSKPESGKATAAVIDMLGQVLGVPPSRIILLRGATSREKLFRLPPAA